MNHAATTAIPKIIAFYLPQFHRIPENDQWWGEGFTEWTNVRKARPLFHGHYQPRIPAAGRYYDLLDPAVPEWQADLARQYGIYGFCYYHYWFNGKRLLERPLELLLERGQPNFPFCLAWANEPWTRIWDGGDRHILMPQEYGGPEAWRHHIDFLIRVFRDPRYIKVYDKPMFLIYRTSAIRDLKPMLDVWTQRLQSAGFPGLHLVGIDNHFGPDPRMHLMDAFADFEPLLTISRFLPRSLRRSERHRKRLRRVGWWLLGRGNPPNSYDYRKIWKTIAWRPLLPSHYPGAFVDWDNTPRRGSNNALVMRNFDPQAFKTGIHKQISKARKAGAEFLFINAWNEWAEGTYLEPDERRGLFFLQAIREALCSSETDSSDKP